MTLRAILFDVGGTLFGDAPDPGDPIRLSRLRLVETFGETAWHDQLLSRSLDAAAFDPSSYVQDTRKAIREVLARNHVPVTDGLVERIRAACCLPLREIGEPRPGAVEALRHVKRRGLKVALVTNVLWRTQADVLADWESFGFTEIDAVATSLDVGRYKPHPAMFERALADLGVDGAEAVMVGNSREADIAPAKRLGLRAVLVRSADTSTSGVEPDAIVTEMTELPAVLSRWL